VLIDAPSEEAARAMLGDDPWSNTIVRIASVVEWTILLDSRPAGQEGVRPDHPQTA
jgi:hypothetical protein